MQISKDGPSVNWCFYDEVVKNREEMSCINLQILAAVDSIKLVLKSQTGTLRPLQKVLFKSYTIHLLDGMIASV